MENVVVAFVHVEPGDIQEDSSAETKLVKNAKWLARKWDVKKILLSQRPSACKNFQGILMKN